MKENHAHEAEGLEQGHVNGGIIGSHALFPLSRQAPASVLVAPARSIRAS
ncbi:MAG: hypothetical protein LBO05_11775 [Deltaproteobacteria bacterium]|jgi:hypothetical protein|nr:hypothetical protein [Deltaproteobacteria bacterium]